MRHDRTFKVDFVNNRVSVNVTANESIYEAALHAGLQLPDRM